MIEPFIASWPQALKIQAYPQNLPTSIQNLADLMDEIWYICGDSSTDMTWYSRRIILGGIYSASELYMITDYSANHEETFEFVRRQLRMCKL